MLRRGLGPNLPRHRHWRYWRQWHSVWKAKYDVPFTNPDLLHAISGTPLGVALAQCGERRGYLDNPYRHWCNQPVCERCRRRYQRWRLRHLLSEFNTAEKVVTFSVRPAFAADAKSAVMAFTDIRQAMRNLARRKSWRGVRACGHLSFSYVDERFWPALSAVADLPRIAHQDFRRDLETVFPVVRVQPVDGDVDNALAVSLSDQLQPSGWPLEVASFFYTALYEVGGGFRPLTFMRGLKALPMMPDDGADEVEPMPWSHSYADHFTPSHWRDW